MLERRLLGPVRVHPLRHLRKLVGIAEQDERAGAASGGDRRGQRHLTRLVDEQRIHEALHFGRGEQPARAGGDRAAARGQSLSDLLLCQDLDAIRLCRLPFIRLLGDADQHPLFLGGLRDRVDHVRDGLVRARGDADPPSLPHEREDHARARVGLAGAGRPLDRKVRVLE